MTRYGKLLPLLAFAFILLWAMPLPAQVFQYENQMVEKIEIVIPTLPEGSTVDTQAIFSRIKTKEGDFFSQTEFDSDLKALAQEFDRVEPTIESIEDKIFITLKLWPKPLIRSIRWSGNQKVNTKRLQQELSIPLRTVFDRQIFNKAFHKLKAYYIKKGFFEAELNYEANIDPVSNEADIEITIKEGRSGRIQNIVFKNFTREEEEAILELMVTKKWNIFTSWFTEEGTYHEEAIQQDQFAVLNYLQSEGYADASVDIDVQEAKTANRIIITITACKGEQYRFGKVSLEGNILFNDEEIWKLFTFRENSPYSPDKIRATLHNISQAYGKRGYIDVIVDYEPRLEPDQDAYSLRIFIDEGEQYRVGLIKVFGNCYTQTNVILHETLLIPGEVFDLEKLKKTEEKLHNIGYFKNVNVYAVRSEGPCSLGSNFRDVHIEVEETSTGNFGAFFGFSTLESVFGGVKVTERNFNYKGLRCIGSQGLKALKGGGEYAHFTTTIGAKSSSYVFSWTKPFFMDTPWSVGFDIERSSTRYISRDYDIDAWGFSLHAKYDINPFLRFGWHYRIRSTDVVVSQENPSAQLIREANNRGLISASGISLSYDSTDHPHKPRCGLRSVFSSEFAGLGGDHTFLGLAYLNTYYIPVCKKGVMRYRADARVLLPLGSTTADTLPLDERLFLGSDNGVRGYRPYAIGPKFPEGDPRGGISMVLFSAEYSYAMWKKVDLFAFLDAGHLSFSRWDLFGDIKASAGYGIRLKILEGGPPLTIGMGYPLNAGNESDIKRFFFTIGGRF